MWFQVHSMRFSGWIVPILALLALALLPFAIALGLLVGALALGVGLVRVLMFPSPEGTPGKPTLRRPSSHERLADPSAIDAEFEVKEDHEKDQDR
ncbi:MAG TPA: hypothetical protein VHE12_13755 [bacterium]|nr:hypothetical protein [bacterium]